MSIPTNCRVGVAKIDITPEVGVSLHGYFHDRVGKTVRDKLFGQALVIETNGCKIAMVACDLCVITGEISHSAKSLIAEATDISPENIMICASHTHTGPMLDERIGMPKAEDYVKQLPSKLAEAVKKADAGLFDGSLRLGSMQAKGYNHNRLLRMLDGKEQHARRGNDEQLIGPSGPVDEQLQTLGVHDDSGKLCGLIVNFGMHPDVIGGGGADFISSDWPGLMAKNVAKVYGHDTVCLFLQGTAGDINQCPYKDKEFLSSYGPDKAEQLGRGLAGAAICASERAEPIDTKPMYVSMEAVPIPYYTREPELMAELQKLKQQEDAEPDTSGFRGYIIDTTENWPNDNKVADFPMQVFRIGDLAIVALAAEVFTEIGTEIKHFSPAKQTMIVTCANEYGFGYIATSDQSHRGSYDNTPFVPKWGGHGTCKTNEHGGYDAYGTRPILSRKLCIDAGRRLTDAAIVVLHRMWPGNTLDKTEQPKHGV